MGLQKYHAKRNFKNTEEPKGKATTSASQTLNFCVQKHDASHLHYDFRLEYKGILLSWAVPKGPSMDPIDKRLAIHVEDHPLEYQYFEGTIPKGNYGAGTVEIWDHGTYSIPDCDTRKAMEAYIKQGMEKGHFKFIMHGEKLQGAFALQKLKKSEPDDKSWLLIKSDDEYASKGSPKIEKPKKEKAVVKKKSKIPEFITPMLASPIKNAFNSDEWLFEIKWDGFRGLAWLEDHKVRLLSRNELLWNNKFPSIIEELKKIPGQAVFDGEVVVLDAKGKPQFQLMQNYHRDRKGSLYYYIFDILFKDGKDLRELPLIERKQILKEYLDAASLEFIRFSDHVLKNGITFFKKAVTMKLEGIMGKLLNSTYQSRRSHDWVKIKTALRQDVVIGGFTEPRGSRKKFGALLVGVYNDKKELVYSGHVGGGFDTQLLKDISEQLQPLAQKSCPFKNPPKPNMPVTWVKPELICEVSFAEWTSDSIMRQPIFHGMRSDISPKAVAKEIPEDLIPKKSKGKKEKEDKKIKNSTDLTLTHLDKVYWPKEGYTKGDLIEYYETMEPYILPYIKDHPLMMHRFPNGIQGSDFYQKDINFSPPTWLETFQIEHESTTVNYVIINDLKSLLYVANLGCIELHPFVASKKSLENPEFCVIDLDPQDIPFKKVVETALVVHDVLDKIGVKNFCKTSGKRGLHILIPLQAKYTFEQSKQFAELIVTCVHQRLPSFTSLERSPKKREKKIYLDFLQNRQMQTLVSPYSVRPVALAPVSTPLDWSEVNDKLNPADFNIKTVPQRVKAKGDVLKPILKATTNFKTAISKLEKLLR